MQHIWKFVCKINGVPHEGELVTDKSRKSRVAADLDKQFPQLREGEVTEMYIAKIR